ncbi:AsnC family transcriptional regulator [Gorillibacterium massiliense]|uniref:siroheme decarboxylase subunit alpha n=1 Tax=Gorillibacterium massiliense TaxID=1280390 RepID=UPI0004BB3FA1|nr:AsnC family transcriptional regulator [Gorillibacterium massiliense]
MPMSMDLVDRQLLNILQEGLPLTEYPYHDIAHSMGLSPDEVLDRLDRLKQSGYIRRIGGILNPAKIGYTSRLYAMEVPEERFRAAAEVVNGFRGVTHNYRRNGRLNMWFTLSAANEEDRISTIATILAHSGTDRIYDFPAERIFKLNVFFDMEKGD